MIGATPRNTGANRLAQLSRRCRAAMAWRSLSASRVGGAQIGAPYRIDETQPCDDSAGERDPKRLDCSKGRGRSHTASLPALCVEMVAAKFQRPGRGMRSTLKIELAPKTIADQHDHFEAVGLVDLAFVCDNYLPRIAVRSYRNRDIGGPIADVLHLDPYTGLELSGRLGWLFHSALPLAARIKVASSIRFPTSCRRHARSARLGEGSAESLVQRGMDRRLSSVRGETEIPGARS
jgi:hypothetical protein